MLLTEGILPAASGNVDLTTLLAAAGVAIAAVEANPEPPKRKAADAKASRTRPKTGTVRRAS
jgi:hypothetical protein